MSPIHRGMGFSGFWELPQGLQTGATLGSILVNRQLRLVLSVIKNPNLLEAGLGREGWTCHAWVSGKGVMGGPEGVGLAGLGWLPGSGCYHAGSIFPPHYLGTSLWLTLLLKQACLYPPALQSSVGTLLLRAEGLFTLCLKLLFWSDYPRQKAP